MSFVFVGGGLYLLEKGGCIFRVIEGFKFLRPANFALIVILAFPQITEYKTIVLSLRKFCLHTNSLTSSLKIAVLTTSSVSSGFTGFDTMGVTKLSKIESKSVADLKIYNVQ